MRRVVTIAAAVLLGVLGVCPVASAKLIRIDFWGWGFCDPLMGDSVQCASDTGWNSSRSGAISGSFTFDADTPVWQSWGSDYNVYFVDDSKSAFTVVTGNVTFEYSKYSIGIKKGLSPMEWPCEGGDIVWVDGNGAGKPGLQFDTTLSFCGPKGQSVFPDPTLESLAAGPLDDFRGCGGCDSVIDQAYLTDGDGQYDWGIFFNGSGLRRVPEPGTLALLSLGLLGLGVTARRRLH